MTSVLMTLMTTVITMIKVFMTDDYCDDDCAYHYDLSVGDCSLL